MKTPLAYHIRRDALMNRLKLVFDLRNSGLTYKQIGDHIGISPCRSRQMFEQAKREFSKEKEWYAGASGKLMQIFWVVGIETREQAADAYANGVLSTVKKIRNYGWETRRELAALLGLPEPTARPSDMAKKWKMRNDTRR